MSNSVPLLKVLVVDDSDVDCTLVAGLLEKNPAIHPFFASNGVEAMAAIEKIAPDLVISDLVMPELDGLELVRRARIKYPLIPVIIMTCQGNEEIAVETLQAGAASYIPKRRLPNQLLPTVQKVLEASLPQRAFAHLLGCLVQSEYVFVLHNDSALFWPLVVYLQESLAHLGLHDATERTRVGMAVAEALANALYHGNLEVDSAIQEEDPAAYEALIQERLHQSPYCDRRIFVEVKLSRAAAVFVIRDEGPGFDPAALPDPTDPANLERTSGRGILLIRSFMDHVVYNARGNEVTLVKRRT
jgi:CheY-like chemotaxis protein/anti-sigma regulatory factor (Ser/Thr protein kinase)